MEELLHPVKQTVVTKVVLLCKMGEKHGGLHTGISCILTELQIRRGYRDILGIIFPYFP